MWHKAEWMGHPMRPELTHAGLLAKLANRYTTRGALRKNVVCSYGQWSQCKNSYGLICAKNGFQEEEIVKEETSLSLWSSNSSSCSCTGCFCWIPWRSKNYVCSLVLMFFVFLVVCKMFFFFARVKWSNFLRELSEVLFSDESQVKSFWWRICIICRMPCRWFEVLFERRLVY